MNKNPPWKHTIAKILKHDSKSELGLTIREWVNFNKLDNFNSLLNYPIDDITPSGNLCYINQNGEILQQTPLKELINLRQNIQHLIDQSEDEKNPLSHENWMKQTNWIFIKYVICHKHSMTPELLKMKSSKKLSRLDINNSIQRKVSQIQMTRNPPHLHKYQMKTQNMTHLLKTTKSKKQQKHFNFIMF